MKKLIAIVLLIAITISLCACAGPSGAKIRTKRAAISAVKKDARTKTLISMRLGFSSLQKVSFSSSSAEDTGSGWSVTLNGTASGVLNGMSFGSSYTYQFLFIATVSYDGVISNQSVVKTTY